ncbi:ankyrin-1-like [Trichogramma pretiosum]|uniref:ankyrin-1-like n=1 Tax=Trichogramma pretiosum TaxID=7493 RepID=UPI000C71A9D4|nr:ankyrin-1-like [Trichogramma pretiosum]
MSRRSQGKSDQFEPQQTAEQWKKIRSDINWKLEAQRLFLLKTICHRIDQSSGRYPDLLQIFQGGEVELLLLDSINICKKENEDRGHQFIEFVARSGYRNEPEHDVETKQPLLCRTTIIHLVARQKIHRWRYLIRELFIIYNRFDANYVDEAGFTHFHAACQAGHTDLVVRFLELGQVDPNYLVRATGDSALHLALAQTNCEVMLKEVLKRGACPNTANRRGEMPLHLIAKRRRGGNRLVNILLGYARERVQLDAQDKEYGRTPLHWLLKRGFTTTAELLLRRGADTNVADIKSVTPLHIICRDGHYNLLQLYFSMKNDDEEMWRINVRDESGNTPLHLALERGHRAVAQSLLRHGADPHPGNARGATPLHLIANKNRGVLKLTKILLRSARGRVQLDAQDKEYGRTPLHWLLKRGFTTTAELLIRRGADTNVADIKSVTPLHIICRDGHYNLLQLYLSMENDDEETWRINVRDNTGNTPLHLALEQGHHAVALVLLRHGADPHTVNARGATPLRLIFERKNNSHDLAKMLYEECVTIRRHPQWSFQLRLSSEETAELLSRSDANPSKPDDHVAATLQIFLRKDVASAGDDVKMIFFKIVDEQMDTRSVATDLFDLIRPSVKLMFSDSCYLGMVYESMYSKSCWDFELRLAKGALTFIEHLRSQHGYELDRNNAIMLMRLFAEQGLLKKTVSGRDDDDPWWDDEEFASRAQQIVRKIIILGYSEAIDRYDKESELFTTEIELSLYDLVKLPVDEAARLRLEPRNYFGFVRSCKRDPTIGPRYTEACLLHVCEIMTRRFFRLWTLDPFMELTQYRLPILCCEAIMKKLKNHDLYHVCLAATGCERPLPLRLSLHSRWGFL